MPRVNRPSTYNPNTDRFEDRPKVKWRNTTRTERIYAAAQRVTAVAAMSGAAMAMAPNGPVDFFGDMGSKRTAAEMKAIAAAQQKAIFAQDLAPYHRYALSYLGVEAVCRGIDCFDRYSINANGMTGNNGLLGYASVLLSFGSQNDISEGNPGEVCLAGSAYDVTPSEVRGGEVSSVSALSSRDDTIIIYPSSNEDASPLTFTIMQDGFLEPSNEATKEALYSYPCDVEIRIQP